jgi:ribosomal protein L11 methyltransferase
MPSETSWFSITVLPCAAALSADQFDGLCAELIELGAAGTAVDRVPEITCYLEGDQDQVDAFTVAAKELGCNIVSISEVKQENWTGACAEVWEPIYIESLSIIPVESLSDSRPCPPDSIRIIPGLGFGTGHHSTTRMVLAALSEYAKRIDRTSLHPRIFDFGTGSGILAIAAAKLMNVQVEGNDIDEGAIDNARDNINLNKATDLVSVSNTPIEHFEGPYDLILANVYGEVLMNQASQVTRMAKPGATAIMSGITEIVWEQVLQVYVGQLGWRLISEQSDGGWVCGVLELVR